MRPVVRKFLSQSYIGAQADYKGSNKNIVSGKVLHQPGKTLPLKGDASPRFLSSFDRSIQRSYLETQRKLAAIRTETCAIQSIMSSIRFLPLGSECFELRYASA